MTHIPTILKTNKQKKNGSVFVGALERRGVNWNKFLGT